jgi:hypothetical protein
MFHRPGDRGSKHLLDVGRFLPDYTAQHPLPGMEPQVVSRGQSVYRITEFQNRTVAITVTVVFRWLSIVCRLTNPEF